MSFQLPTQYGAEDAIILIKHQPCLQDAFLSVWFEPCLGMKANLSGKCCQFAFQRWNHWFLQVGKKQVSFKWYCADNIYKKTYITVFPWCFDCDLSHAGVWKITCLASYTNLHVKDDTEIVLTIDSNQRNKYFFNLLHTRLDVPVKLKSKSNFNPQADKMFQMCSKDAFCNVAVWEITWMVAVANSHVTCGFTDVKGLL